jgi:hypothetical protein
MSLPLRARGKHAVTVILAGVGSAHFLNFAASLTCWMTTATQSLVLPGVWGRRTRRQLRGPQAARELAGTWQGRLNCQHKNVFDLRPPNPRQPTPARWVQLVRVE